MMRTTVQAFLSILFGLVAIGWPGEVRGEEKHPLLLMTEDYPPENYVITKDGKEQVVGSLVDVVKEIQKRIGSQVPIQVLVWEKAYEQLLKVPNAALFPMGKNPQREKELKLVGELGSTAFTFFTKTGNDIQILNLEDAKSYKIGVYRSDVSEQFLREQGFNNLQVAQTDEYNLDRLLAGEIDLWLVGDLKAWMLAGRKGIAPTDISAVFVAFTSPLYIGFNQDTDDKTVELWQSTLEKVKADGTYQKIQEAWIRKLSAGE